MRAALLSLLLASGCNLFAAGVPCHSDDNCLATQRCTAGLCVVAAEGEGAAAEGEGTAAEGEGTAAEGEGTAAEGEGAAAEGEGAAAEGEGSAEGEGAAAEGEGEGSAGEGEGAAAEGEGGAGEGEGSAGEGEGSVGDFVAWNVNEPNDFLGVEDCAALTVDDASGTLASGEWSDGNCFTSLSYACDGVVPNCTVFDAAGHEVSLCNPQPWAFAEDGCAGANNQLVHIHDDAENVALVEDARSIGIATLWIGAAQVIDNSVEGPWQWRDGTNIATEQFEDWAPGQPLFGDADACLALALAGNATPASRDHWEEVGCNEVHPFACEELSASTFPAGCDLFAVGSLPPYVFCSTPLTYDDAARFCAQNFGDAALASDFHKAFHDELTSVAEIVLADTDMWLAADNRSGAFLWRDGAPVLLP